MAANRDNYKYENVKALVVFGYAFHTVFCEGKRNLALEYCLIFLFL
jgi:hypothetical protein